MPVDNTVLSSLDRGRQWWPSGLGSIKNDPRNCTPNLIAMAETVEAIGLLMSQWWTAGRNSASEK
jgi:hypothetical protein